MPLLLKSAPLLGLSGSAVTTSTPPLDWQWSRFTPSYPVPSPLEDVLRLVTPGLDDFPTEKYAYDLQGVLYACSEALKANRFTTMRPLFADDAILGSLQHARTTLLRNRHSVEVVRHEFETSAPLDAATFLQQLPAWLGRDARVDHAQFEVTSIEPTYHKLESLATTVHYEIVLESGAAQRQQRTGVWQIDWQQQSQAWQIKHLKPVLEVRSTVHGPAFADVTSQAFNGVASYDDQLLLGLDHWRTVIDGASGIDVYGNNGVAAGDYDNDGFDDLYVSQPSGLPNRLYRNRGDGTFEDVTEKAGVGVLDNTACALFADFRNVGLQDLLVVCGNGPLLFQNKGDGTFSLKQDAFHFAQPPQGTFTHAAIADYDRDGRLDVYFCLYSYYLGLDQYHYPTPYFDAQNGPPNFLMQNQGDGTFADRTAAAGLSAENDRYSFACAWGDTADGKMPDLYVVNDFGRNNLYRSSGDGTFRAESAHAHVQDVGAGMSACWADIDNDSKPDLYVANMWSAAGQRIAQQPNFHGAASPATRELYRRHARGNALYRNVGDGNFKNISEAAGVELGRWAWGSDAWDFDHDGFQDLYVTNGYITAPQVPAARSAATQIDLGSFFWRQVVAKSPDDATPSLAYERGWNALNELIRTDTSWSGNERNVLFANNGDGTFSDVSGALGLDFPEDGRAFALADLDHDGRLEIILKNRNGPQLRILHNSMDQLGDSIAFQLRGTTSNRDAIGAVVTLQCGALVQTHSLQAGTGFLAQHSKQLFFGLGKGQSAIHASVRWPNGVVQQFNDLPRNSRIQLVEGEASPLATPFAPTAKAYGLASAPAAASQRSKQTMASAFGTWLLDPLKAPLFTLASQSGTPVSLASFRGRNVMLHFWSSHEAAWQARLNAFNAIPSAILAVVAVNVDGPSHQSALPRLTQAASVLLATPELAGIYNIVFRYLFDRRANLPLPTSFLLDSDGMIVKVYQGPVAAENLVADVRQISSATVSRSRFGLPFPGTLYQGSFVRNDFTYGVAMFQHGYLDQAADSFQQVIARHPDNAEAHYNLGTLNLRRKDFGQAQLQLRQTLALKPNYPEAWNNIGMMAAQQGHTQEAIDSFGQSLAQRPNYLTALINLGNLYRHERNFAEAETYLGRAFTVQPTDPEVNYSLGMLFAQQSKLAPAADYLQKALALRPNYPEALNNLGVLYVRQGDLSKAEQQFLTCIRLDPTYEGTYVNLARLYLTQGDKAKARKAIADLLALNPESSAGKQALQALESN